MHARTVGEPVTDSQHIDNSHKSAPSLRRIIDDILVGGNPRVLTAHDRLDRPVSWVHSSEIYEIGPLLAGGELLLTTGLGLAGLDAGTRRHYIRDLAERGVAGLAFEVGRSFDEIPDEVIREGSARRLPIVELRQVVPFIEICRAANTAIVSTEVSDLRLRGALDAVLHDDMASSGGVARMLEHISDAAHCPIVLVGSGGALIAAHGVDDDRSAWRAVDEQIASVPIVARGRHIARLFAGPAGVSAHAARAGVSAHAARAEGSMARHLVAMLLECASGPLTAALVRAGSGRSAVGARLIEELLAARPIRRADLFARLSGSGVPVSASAHIVPVTVESPDPRMAENALVRAASGLGGAVYETVDATVHGLVVVPSATDEADPHADAVDCVAAAFEQIGAHGGRVTVVVGHSCPTIDAAPGPALSLAVAASLRTCAERLGAAVESARTSGSARRVFTARALAGDAAARTIAADVRDELLALVEPLMAHDRAQSTRLAHTLDTHLRNGCSATRSAQALHIGRQSLYQRLDRIRTVLGFDPTQPDVYGSVMMAFAVSRAE